MNQLVTTVVENTEITPSVYLTWFRGGELLRGYAPGRFVMVRCGSGRDPLLPRPFSIHRRRSADEFALVYRVVGAGTDWLAHLRPGDPCEIFGPLGQPFKIEARSRNLLLIAGGLGVAPIVALADQAVARDLSVTLLLGAATAADLYPSHLVPPEVELVCATDDGSAGARGFVTELLPEYLPWADQVYTCGPHAMFERLGALVRRLGTRKRVQAALETFMACGMGGCWGCVEKTRHGYKRVCTEGPVFDLLEVF
jgi:dihydroorotate dehydrogenase electron transfer subunit